MTGAVRQVHGLGEERLDRCSACSTRHCPSCLIVPFDLGVDHAARQDQVRVIAAEERCRTILAGIGSTDAEKTELITLPAIRILHRSAVLGKRFDLAGQRVRLWVGDGRRRVAVEDAMAVLRTTGRRQVGKREQALALADVHIGVLHVAADQAGYRSTG